MVFCRLEAKPDRTNPSHLDTVPVSWPFPAKEVGKSLILRCGALTIHLTQASRDIRILSKDKTLRHVETFVTPVLTSRVLFVDVTPRPECRICIRHSVVEAAVQPEVAEMAKPHNC